MKIFKIALLYAMTTLPVMAQDEETKEEKREVTIIHAGTLLPIAGELTKSSQSIVVEDNKIIEVVNGYINNVDDAEVTIVDLKDKFVMAGLMDAHIHMAEGDLNNPGANGADHAIMGVKNSRKALMAGFTTVRDLGARDDTLYKIIKAIDNGDIVGPRIIPGGIIIGVGHRDNGRECNGIESCRKTTRDMIREGAQWIKIRASCRGGQLCAAEDGPPIFFDDEIATIIDVANKYDIPVATHSHTRDSSLQVLNYDIDSLEHGTFMNEEAMDMLIEKDIIYVPTVSNLDETKMDATDPNSTQILRDHNQAFVDRHPQTIMKAYEKGVKIAAGTDGDGRNIGTNYREVEYFVSFGMPENDALKSATVTVAEMLGFSDTLGTIEEGKIADIIAVEGNPLNDIKDIRNVTFVMKEGVIYKD